MAQILLVDDEKVARALYGDFLTGAGHTVVAVATAKDAQDALEKQKFDLVVTDLILPQSDGMELLQWVKGNHPETEVIVITALDKVDPAVRAVKSGASDYLVKPINPEVLAHAVKRALTTRSVLKQNEDLKKHVALMETGQRIATTLDKDKLFPLVAQSYAQSCGASAVLVAVKTDKGFVVEGSFGLSAEELEPLKTEFEASLTGAIDRDGQDLLIALPAPYETAWLAAAVDQDHTLGAVALLFPGDVAAASVTASGTLGFHFGLALKNLGRFAEVEDLVYLDDLTHLFNIRYLQLILDKELKSAAEPEAKPFSLLFLDLDYFKSVNDTHGHSVGSKLLVEVARVLKGCVRDGDVVTRFGGDEFVILLRGTDSGGSLKVAERIRRSIESHRFLAREGYSLTMTTSIGIASYPEHAQDKAQLLDSADRAMYRGKKGTRNIIYMAAKGLEATPPARHHADKSLDEKPKVTG